MKLILKILLIPFILVIDIFTFLCIGLISCSSLIFGFASFLLTLLGITVLATYSWQNGLILLFLAYLASPMGLPMFAVKLLSCLQYITGTIKAL
ncbi:MAG: CD1845 family protein [Oscillospiraceae bacterium]